MSEHPRERLSAYLDDELPDPDAAAVERHIASCTECSRELMIMRDLGGAMRTMSQRYERGSTWSTVHRRLTRPVGWVLVVAGTSIWAWLIVSRWMRAELTLEWAAGTAIGLGLALLLVGIGIEQYRDWRDSRYRDVEL